MKKIVIVSPAHLPVPATLGGAIESTIQLLLEQNEIYNQVRFHVFATWEENAEKISKNYKNTIFHFIKRDKLFHLKNTIIRILRRINRICQLNTNEIDLLDVRIIKKTLIKEEFDKIIIHGNSYYLESISNSVPKEKIIFYVHANIFDTPNIKNRRTAHCPGKLVTVSQFIKNEIIKNTGLDSNQIIVIKNPINYDLFSKAKELESSDLRRTLQIADNEVVIIFTGRLVEDKGLGKLLESLLLLKSDILYKLIVIGSFGSGFGNYEKTSSFRQVIETMADKIRNKVVFTGFVHNSELPQYFAIADIVTMPSLCDEAAGKVAMEAMTAGIPVITTKSGGIPEYVSSEAGILLERDENLVENLKNSIECLIQDQGLRNKMGAKGAVLAEDFKPIRFYDNYIKL